MAIKDKLDGKGFYYGYDPKGNAEPNCFWKDDVMEVVNEYEELTKKLFAERKKYKAKLKLVKQKG